MDSSCVFCRRAADGTHIYMQRMEYETSYARTLKYASDRSKNEYKCILKHITEAPHLKQFYLEYRIDNIYYLRRLLAAVKQNKSIDRIDLVNRTTLSSDPVLQALSNTLRLQKNIKEFFFETQLVFTQLDRFIIKLADMIKSNTQLEVVDLSLDSSNYCANPGIYNEDDDWVIHPSLLNAYRYLIDVVKTHPNIDTFVIRQITWINNVASLMFDLLDNPRITDLSFRFWYNIANSTIVLFLYKLAQNTTLQHLHLNSFEYDNRHSSNASYDAIASVFQHNKTLKSFSLVNFTFVLVPFLPFTSWGTFIAQNTTLQELYLTDIVFSNTQLEDIIKGINQNTSLHTLTLAPVFDSPVSFETFQWSGIVLTNTNIVTLKTNMWNIKSTVTYLSINPCLTELTCCMPGILSGNDISLLPLLLTTGNLRSLNISAILNYTRIYQALNVIPDAVLQNMNELEKLTLSGDKVYSIEPYLERNRIRNMSLFTRLLSAVNFLEAPSDAKRPRSSSRLIAKRMRTE